MIKSKYAIVLIGLSVILSNCQQNKNNENKDTLIQTEMDTLAINEKKIREYFAEYINIPIPEEGDDGIEYYMSEEDLKIVIPIIYNNLKRNEFQFISDEKFQDKLKNIFGITLNTESQQLINHTDFISYVVPPSYDPSRTVKDIASVEFLYHNIFFIKKYNFISPLPMIEDFVKIDNNKIINITPLNIIHQNKYLFNDSNASLTWLMNNDSQFLESLVNDFGYVKDQKLLKWMIERTEFRYNYHTNEATNLEEFLQLLVHRDCQGKLRINQETLDFMKENTNTDVLGTFENYVKQIHNFINITAFFGTDNALKCNYSFQEQAMIYAHLLYWGEKICDNEYFSSARDYFMDSFYQGCKETKQKYDEEFERNNYYNLPDFEKYWNKAVDNYNRIYGGSQ